MKKITLLFSKSIFLMVMLTLFNSCEKSNNYDASNSNFEESKILFSVVQNSIIGYIDDNSHFVAITSSQLESFFQQIEAFSNDGELNSFNVVQDTVSTSSYSLIAKATDGDEFVSLRIGVDNVGTNQFALSTDSVCTCTSKGCDSWGCNVSNSGPCSCSSCGSPEGECTKTNSRIVSMISSYFN